MFYYFAKSKFKNSLIYHYTPQRLHQITGISINTIRKHIGILKKYNLVEFHHGNLLFRSLFKINNDLGIEDKFYELESVPWNTLKDFKDKYYLKILKINYKAQVLYEKMNILIDGSLKNHLSKSSLKRYRRIAKKKYFEVKSDIFFSTRQIGRLFGYSHTWGLMMLKRLENKKMLTYKKIIRRIKELKEKIDIKLLNFYNIGYYYIKDSILYLHKGLSISFQ